MFHMVIHSPSLKLSKDHYEVIRGRAKSEGIILPRHIEDSAIDSVDIPKGCDEEFILGIRYYIKGR